MQKSGLCGLNPYMLLWVAHKQNFTSACYSYQIVHYFDIPCVPKVTRWHCFHKHQVFPFVNFTDKINFIPK